MNFGIKIKSLRNHDWEDYYLRPIFTRDEMEFWMKKFIEFTDNCQYTRKGDEFFITKDSKPYVIANIINDKNF